MEKLNIMQEITLKSKFSIGNTVCFKENNKIVKSKVITIIFPKVIQFKKSIEQTGFLYRVSRNTHVQKTNSNGIPECWLFRTKKELIKTL